VIAYTFNPVTNSIYTVAGSNSNTIESGFYHQADSALFNVYDSDTSSTISLVFNYSNTTFYEYTEPNSNVRRAITTSPYGWY